MSITEMYAKHQSKIAEVDRQLSEVNDQINALQERQRELVRQYTALQREAFLNEQ